MKLKIISRLTGAILDNRGIALLPY